MNFVAVFMMVFSVIGAVDYIFGNKLGVGKEFEKGFMMLGKIVLSMLGMIILAPVIGELMKPGLEVIYNTFGIDPSLLPTMVLANDMGGYSLAQTVAKNESLGLFNGLVVSSMMGCTVSFTIPFALRLVKQEHHKNMFLGFLCGVVTIPIGCFISGMVLKINILTLIFNMIPMIIFSGLVALGIVFIPNVCVKIFTILGYIINILIIIGLALGVIQFLTGYEVIKGLDSFENGAIICFNAAAVMSGAFPFLHILAKVLSKPAKKFSKVMKVKEESVLGFVSSLASSVLTFEEMNNMDAKGVVLNSAFAVSGAFVFAGHLAFTMAFNADYIFPVIIGKLISGVSAVVLAVIIYKRQK